MSYESEPIIPWHKIDSKMLERASGIGITVSKTKYDSDVKIIYLTSQTLDDNDITLDVFGAENEQLLLGLHIIIDDQK